MAKPKGKARAAKRAPQGPRKQYRKWGADTEMERTTLYFPAETHRELKMESAATGKPMSELVLEAWKTRKERTFLIARPAEPASAPPA